MITVVFYDSLSDHDSTTRTLSSISNHLINRGRHVFHIILIDTAKTGSTIQHQVDMMDMPEAGDLYFVQSRIAEHADLGLQVSPVSTLWPPFNLPPQGGSHIADALCHGLEILQPDSS